MNDSWKKHLLSVARAIASKSKDTTKVGAIAVDDNNFIKSTGFNGVPIGVKDLPERLTRPEKYGWVEHAEASLVASAARLVLEGTTVVVTHQPCDRCARLLIQAGVKEVIYASTLTNMQALDPGLLERSKTMFLEAGVVCEHVEEGETS